VRVGVVIWVGLACSITGAVVEGDVGVARGAVDVYFAVVREGCLTGDGSVRVCWSAFDEGTIRSFK
jgi:hypothetical protein